jgi:hypothetical protein
MFRVTTGVITSDAQIASSLVCHFFVSFEKYNRGPWTSSECMASYCNNTKSYDKSHHIDWKSRILESNWPAIRILFNSNICLYKERLCRRLYVRLGNAIKYVCFFLNHVLNNSLHKKKKKKRKNARKTGRRLINYSFNVLNWIRREGPCLGFSVPSLTVVDSGRCCQLPSIN